MGRYGNNSDVKWVIDKLQIDLECCGSQSYTDWWNIEWVPAKYINLDMPEVYQCSIPITAKASRSIN